VSTFQEEGPDLAVTQLVGPETTSPEPPPAGRRSRWWLDDRLVALVTWVLGVALAFVIVKVAKADPVSIRGSIMPIGVGAGVFSVLLLVAWKFWGRFANTLVGLLVGAYAAWVALTLKAALYGTPMASGGMLGDAHRIAAQAEKYSTSWFSTDIFLPNTPSDYPPLYPWLTGRVAQLTGVPAWKLLQNTQVLWMSATVIVVYLLWRHLVPAPLAAVVAMLAFANNTNPIKAYEVIILAVMVPWIISTFGNPPRGRLHWLPAGIIGGLIFLTYQGYAVFMGLGVLAILWWTWRGAEDRRAYLLHLLKVAVTALVVASWYLVPYVWASLTRSTGSFGSDTYQSGIIATDALPLHFFDPNPYGVLQLVGLVGLVVFFNRGWWARPLAALLIGTYGFFALGLLRFVLTGHTMFYQYAIGPIVTISITAGILTVADAVGLLAAHRWGPSARRALAVLTVAVLAWSSLVAWRAWMPTTVLNVGFPHVAATAGRPADLAHIESLPDLSRSRWAPAGVDTGAIPVTQIQAEVAQRYGPDFRPMVLSQDERLFAYTTWYCYIGQSPTASPALDRWADRNAELTRLAAVTDPDEFARQAQTTGGFGRIDAFLLKRVLDPNGVDTGELQWHTGVNFTAAQFAPTVFDRVDLPNDYVLLIRHPAA
jgi:hypothetical protein